MTFVHDVPEFGDLLQIVAATRRLSPGLVEKDYWVTHTLWALEAAGFEFWFKGGTSLSKGFGLIERFSEDLDLKVEPGRVAGLPVIANWKNDRAGATALRRRYFEMLVSVLVVPGGKTMLELDTADRAWRSANLRVEYPGQHLADLGGLLRPFVLLEVGHARVTPSVPRSLTSFVHDELAKQELVGEFHDNRPTAVRCVHPLVTLLEKLDALHRHVARSEREPASFVRHFEDAARIIRAEASLPPLVGYPSMRVLAAEMLGEKQIAEIPTISDPAFTPDASPRWDAIRAAHEAIAPMFWGPRIALEDTCDIIRGWIDTTLS